MAASLYGENSEANQQRIGIYITSCVGGRDGERTTAMRFSRGISALNWEDCFQKNNTGKSNSWRSDFGQEYSIHRNNKFTKRKMG